ncbi:GDSL esterase/lipase-like [Dorcoceras hygrometricum]|uniref:GDSL esterase/lipase-like n=1 Tax=Dorcoceras hygrometricum TaxID=472368 RepID=A0A2Z7CFF4_9LAMI|nr:GDSL esterase/lipase-like [Dorcoceras hygrometricum]
MMKSRTRLPPLPSRLAPPPCTAAAAASHAGICSGQLFEEFPSVPISSGLLVQADEGVSLPVVDLIDVIYRHLPLSAGFLVKLVGARRLDASKMCENPKIQLSEIEPKQIQIWDGQLRSGTVNSDSVRSTQIGQLRPGTVNSQLKYGTANSSGQQSDSHTAVNSQLSFGLVNSALDGQFRFGDENSDLATQIQIWRWKFRFGKENSAREFHKNTVNFHAELCTRLHPSTVRSTRFRIPVKKFQQTGDESAVSPLALASCKLKFYLHAQTHGRRQQLRDLALANYSLHEGYRMKELLKRSPTLPQTSKKVTENDGNLPEKLTVNSVLGFEAKNNNREKISLNSYCWTLKFQQLKNPTADQTSRETLRQLISNENQQLVQALHSKTTTFPPRATGTLTRVDVYSQRYNQTTHMRTDPSQLIPKTLRFN